MSLSFSFVDVLIVLIVLVSAGYAAWRGFLSETLSVFAWISAAFACLYFGPYFAPLTHGLVSTPWLASVVAYAAVFVAVFIPFAFMSHRFSQTVKNSPIGPLDRALGVAFGVVRGLVLIGVAYLAFTYFVPIRAQPKWMTDAKLLPAVQSTSEVLLSLIPNQKPVDLASRPAAEEPVVIRQAPPQSAGPAQQTHTDDPLADMIRHNGAVPRKEAEKEPRKDERRTARNDSVRKTTPEPMQHRTVSKDTKRYGAQDRQALDRLIEATGSGK